MGREKLSLPCISIPKYSKNRDQAVINNVGPFFRLFYQGLEKLPRTKVKAGRAVKVKNIPRFRKLFEKPPENGEFLLFCGG